jgi:hypothetical protein
MIHSFIVNILLGTKGVVVFLQSGCGKPPEKYGSLSQFV